MKVSQHAALWVAIAVTALVLLVLLRHILLPFVVGMALAYLLAPIVRQAGAARDQSSLRRPDRHLAAGLRLRRVHPGDAPAPHRRGGSSSSRTFPGYVARIQSLVTDANRPWLHKIMGHELQIEQSAAQIVTTVGGDWLDDASALAVVERAGLALPRSRCWS